IQVAQKKVKIDFENTDSSSRVELIPSKVKTEIIRILAGKLSTVAAIDAPLDLLFSTYHLRRTGQGSVATRHRSCHGGLLLSYPYLGGASWVCVCSHLDMGCVAIGDEDIVVRSESGTKIAVLNVTKRAIDAYFPITEGGDDYERSIAWYAAVIDLLELFMLTYFPNETSIYTPTAAYATHCYGTSPHQEYLLEFMSEYGISEALHPELPGPDERIVDFPKGKVDERVFPTIVDWRTSAPKDGMSAENNIDLFSLIRAPNPTKVKTGTRPCAAHEVPLLTVTASRVIEMVDPVAATDSSGVPFTIERPSERDCCHGSPCGQRTPQDGQRWSRQKCTPKVLRRDHDDSRPTESTHGGKSLAAMGLRMGSTRPVPASQGAPVDVSDPDSLSFIVPQSRPTADVAQSSKGAATA
nr:hypothetical protein [Tanacetum cinerariifolium]